jgi:hypothetical protein
MSTLVHIGTQKKAGNIPILSQCVGITPTHLYRPIGIDNDPIVHSVLAASSQRPRSVLATLYDLSSAPTFGTIFILGASPRKQESVLSNNEKITNSSP